MRYDIPAEAACVSCGHSYSFHVSVRMTEQPCDGCVGEEGEILCGCDRFVEYEEGMN